MTDSFSNQSDSSMLEEHIAIIVQPQISSLSAVILDSEPLPRGSSIQYEDTTYIAESANLLPVTFPVASPTVVRHVVAWPTGRYSFSGAACKYCAL